MSGHALLGHRIDPRIRDMSQDDFEFIYSAVEAGWKTPRIMAEVPHMPAAVFMVARAARQEMAAAHRACEFCRREIASGKRAA